MPATKHGLKAVLRGLNVLNQQMREAGIPQKVGTLTGKFHGELTLFKDIDQTVTALKRLIRKCMKRRILDVTLMLNFFHVEYFLQCVTRVERFCYAVRKQYDGNRYRLPLLMMAKGDHAALTTIKSVMMPCIMKTWKRCQVQIEMLLFTVMGTNAFYKNSFLVYCEHVLKFGQHFSPLSLCYFSRVMKREYTGKRETGLPRISPTCRRGRVLQLP